MLKTVFSLAVILLYSGSCFSCEKPAAPEIPDSSSAVTAQMVKAQNDVKAFVSAAEEYLKCERNDRKADQMASEMQSVADNFNSAIKAYKARMGS